MGELTPRVACVGMNLESEIALEGLVANAANVVALVTLPPRASDGVSDYRDLHPMCAEAGIAAIDTVDINSSDTLAALRKVEPDYIFTLGWSQLFKRELLELPRHYVVGSHPSLLPSGRGRAPIPWTILQGLERSGVTLFEMSPRADAGPVLLQREFEIPSGSYAWDVYMQVASTLRDAFCDLYQRLRAGPLGGAPQGSEGASYRAKRTPRDGLLDFSESAEAVERLIRAVSKPYPGAYAYHQGRPITIWKASREGVPQYVGAPGQVLMRRGGRLLVQAGDQPLWLSDFSLEGVELVAREFPRGSRFGFSPQDEIYQLRRELEEVRQRLRPQ